jgi:ABC-type transport system involved in multi-copper enzyme maturation permease subunit
MTLPRITELPPSALAIAAALVLLAAVLMLRPLWLRLLGPVFVYESDRVARKGRVFLLRCLFIAASLTLLLLVYPHCEYLSLNAMSRFAHDFTDAFLIGQGVVVLLLTPIHTAGAISEEKEKRSLDLLLETRLSSIELVWGKLASRMLPIIAFVLAPLPVLAITQLWGGVDLPRILAGSAAIILSAVSLGAFSLLCSVLAHRTIPALAAAYLIPAAVAATWFASVQVTCAGSPAQAKFLTFAASPHSFEAYVNAIVNNAAKPKGMSMTTISALGLYTVIHSGIALIFVGLASVFLRSMSGRGLVKSIPLPTIKLRHGAGGETALVVAKPVQPYIPLPPVWDSALLWKECHLGRKVVGVAMADLCLLSTIFIALVFSLVVQTEIRSFEWPAELVVPFRVVMIMCALYCAFAVGLHLAVSVAREREQLTIESLRSFPSPRSQILTAKWWGAWFRQRRALIVLALSMTAVFVLSRVDPLAYLLLLLSFIVFAAFAGALGLFLSVCCQSTQTATSSTILILVGALTLPWLHRHFSSDEAAYAGQASRPLLLDEEREIFPSASVSNVLDESRWEMPDALNPIRVWWLLSEPVKSEHQKSTTSSGAYRVPPLLPPDLIAEMIGFSIYALAALALWFAAKRLFLREPARA